MNERIRMKQTVIEVEVRTIEPTRRCTHCGEVLPISKFMKTGKNSRRHVCNHCFYLHTLLPCRNRALVRESEKQKKMIADRSSLQ
ncbi:MAG: hypothetical protein IJ669_04815 [Prevotella sp.]|nr:hypothetical protein [Prevotella sp.]